MRYPSFYDRVEPIRLYDPLSDFLGDGEIEFKNYLKEKIVYQEE
jgi:hypothetical protein